MLKFRQRRGIVILGAVLADPLSYFESEIDPVESGIPFLQDIDHTQALEIVLEAPLLFHQLVHHAFPGMTEGRMPQIVGQHDGLGKIFVQAKRTSDGARYLGNLDGVRKTGPVMVPLVVNENLRLVFQPTECAGVNDPVSVPLEDGSERIFLFREPSPTGLAAFYGIGCKAFRFLALEFPPIKHAL